MTTAAAREHFWILRGRQSVKRVLRKRVEGQPFSLPQPPEERVSDYPPFTHTGVDFAGSLYTKEKGANAENSKAYFCLFTCALTRAVHLELRVRLSTEAFLMEFHQFTS